MAFRLNKGEIMKTIQKVCGWVLLAVLAGCGNAQQINGHNLNTALKSVSFIKEHLPAQQRFEFEMAYWALRKQIKDDQEFLKAIDGKSAQDLIASAKADFAKQKATGIEEYAAYDNWDQMVSRQIEQRNLQEPGAADTRDKKGYPRVDYKLHSM